MPNTMTLREALAIFENYLEHARLKYSPGEVSDFGPDKTGKFFITLTVSFGEEKLGASIHHDMGVEGVPRSKEKEWHFGPSKVSFNVSVVLGDVIVFSSCLHAGDAEAHLVSQFVNRYQAQIEQQTQRANQKARDEYEQKMQRTAENAAEKLRKLMR